MEDLLLHRSRVVPDFYWSDAAIAAAFRTSLPVTEAQLASFKCTEALLATAPDYSNYGYALLGMVVARLRGAPSLAEAIKTTLLDPLGITRIRSATSLASTSFADEARYHRSSEAALKLVTLPSVMTADQPLVADVYGNLHLEHGAGAGGMAAAAVDLARVAAAFSVTANNPMLSRAAIDNLLNLAAHSGRPRAGHGFDAVTPVGSTFLCEKGGYLWTSQTGLRFTIGGLGIVVCYNGVNDAVLFQTRWPIIQQAVNATTWPAATDFFPDYGMRAF